MPGLCHVWLPGVKVNELKHKIPCIIIHIISHMIVDNLSDVVILSHLLQLTKVIDQRSHTGREV